MKSVLVTGGTKRLGAAIAGHLRHRGWKVLTSSHREDSGADFVADLSDPAAAARLYLKALQSEGELVAIVNNAALFVGDEETMREVNLESPKKLTMLLAGREGVKCSVVNVLDSEIMDGVPSSAEGVKRRYLETKRGLFDYTRKSACLFAGSLRVNAVAPGPVLAPEAVHEKALETLLDRRPDAEDVAEAVAYLLEAKSVTGVVLPVDGGGHLLA
jgi:NAD(P)-dependent dehydrogenase (short-subunit alcohol dehydrogenase family)